MTITAADRQANMSTRDIKVTVTNAEEDGKVKLSQSNVPRVGLAITASYPVGGPAACWSAVDGQSHRHRRWSNRCAHVAVEMQ